MFDENAPTTPPEVYALTDGQAIHPVDGEALGVCKIVDAAELASSTWEGWRVVALIHEHVRVCIEPAHFHEHGRGPLLRGSEGGSCRFGFVQTVRSVLSQRRDALVIDLTAEVGKVERERDEAWTAQSTAQREAEDQKKRADDLEERLRLETNRADLESAQATRAVHRAHLMERDLAKVRKAVGQIQWDQIFPKPTPADE
jgi:hypothetical protein